MNQAYPVVLAIGCLAGLGWLVARRASSAESGGDVFTAALVSLVLGLAGARLGFVALHLPYFRRHPVEALWIWEGGLSWVGAALGVLAAIALMARTRRRPSMALADALAIPAVIVALAAWTGCLFDRCLYGIPVPASPMALPTPDVFGTIVPRWPTAVVGLAATGILLAGLVWATDRQLPPGLRASLALGALALTGLALSFTRADPSLLVMGLRLDAIGALGLLALAAISGFLVWARRHR
ncbi:MAG TPA: prolipoprotein diacylglyceryl transferase family protein [Anaerolineales bacterium]|nr:prolipoprotein diacylglyceryl transferase family protein [Anaerolineales bacterium]